MHNFKELEVWKKSMKLARNIYQASRIFPKEELYGFTAQIRRCAVSVPTNIAEGAGRSSDFEFLHFLDIALGSAYELETLVLLSEAVLKPGKDLIGEQLDIINEIQQMIVGLRRNIEKRTSRKK